MLLRFAGLSFTIFAAIVPSFPCAGESEKEALASVISAGGNVRKDASGRVSLIILHGKRASGKHEPITDGEMEKIDFAAFSRLESVAIVGNPLVTDRSILHLAKISVDLEFLTVAHAKISDGAVAKLLKRQSSLFSLDLTGTPISNAAATEIATLKGLRVLSLDGTKITDPGVKELSNMNRLMILGLSRTAISDAALSDISRMAELRDLFMDGTKVSDAGIQKLATLKNLATISLSGTNVTAGGKAALEKLLPEVKISGVPSAKGK